MIDDYTTIHSIRRPKDLKTSQTNNMCTIIFKVFPEIQAISRPPPQQIHIKDGIKPHDVPNDICSGKQMTKLSCTFATCFPELTASFFDPLLERKHLESHDYGASTDVNNMRKFRNVYLVDFFMHPLKSKNDYMEALERVLKLDKLKEYLSKFVVVFPGDHPSQFFPRQIVHGILSKYVANLASNTPVPQEVWGAISAKTIQKSNYSAFLSLALNYSDIFLLFSHNIVIRQVHFSLFSFLKLFSLLLSLGSFLILLDSVP